ncbi:MAG: hypothetical protein ABIY37_07930, partial [Devosia sp.]
RPETWRMLRRTEAETRTLLGSIGVAESVATTEMEVVADLPQTVAALDYMAHMAFGHGHQVRRTMSGWSFRHVPALDLDAIERRLGDWLKAAGAVSIDEGAVDADITVLTDDEAIFDSIAEADRPLPLISQAMTSTLIVSPRALPTPVRRFADRGVTLMARPGNTVLAIISGEQDVDARLASTLPGPFPMKRLATTRYRRFITADGAPIIGNAGTQFIVAGLGDVAPFFARSIARLLAGVADDDEKLWLAAHDPAVPRAAIADFVSPAEATA